MNFREDVNKTVTVSVIDGGRDGEGREETLMRTRVVWGEGSGKVYHSGGSSEELERLFVTGLAIVDRLVRGRDPHFERSVTNESIFGGEE